MFYNSLTGFMSSGAEKAWIDITAAMWTQGDVASFTLGTGTVSTTAADKTIITANDFIAADQDFDYRMACSAFADQNGLGFGWTNNGILFGGNIPKAVDPTASIRNGGGAAGLVHDGNLMDVDGAGETAGWMASKRMQLSRRTATFYVLMDDVLYRTFTEITSTTAGNLFIISFGGTTSISMTGVQYRVGPGLPAIS